MNLSIRLLQKNELTIADDVFRLAFGTFIGLPQPRDFLGDASYIANRWQMDPTAAFAAEVDGKLVGSNIAANWGSVGTFGPLSVHPDYWNQKIAQQLVEAVITRFTQWGIQQAGLFTFPNSPKHHALYQKFGFYPRFLTFIMAKELPSPPPDLAATVTNSPSTKFSGLNSQQQADCLKACAQLTDAIYSGLDLSREIEAVHSQNLGDTVLLWDDTGLAGFAICHCGTGSEAGSNVCYVKFAAVRPGLTAGEQFETLLTLCETYGANQNMRRLVAGVNTSHDEAYRRMVDRQYRTEIVGVAMHRPNDSGYNRADVFVLDDWR
ncbi:MAG: GNAT family N-acetyltransferase [Alkalinema sp. CACIAM 70d]|nr:MAG: GNAT family N-acetyltransferase [Alkalinema sp. CACIAM 70d]